MRTPNDLLPPPGVGAFDHLLERLAEEIGTERVAPNAQYQKDPVGYIRNVLHMDLTPAQDEICRSVVDNRRTGAQASHAVGKTVIAAALANWWQDCWEEHIVYVTAPTWGQAHGLTFKNIRLQREANALPGRILESGEVRDLDNQRRLKHFIKALNAESGEGFQGEHTAPILVILEEAVGVPHYIWEALEGLMTDPRCRVLAIANPTNQETDFGSICDKPTWNIIAISALKHPNVEAELLCQRQPFPGAVSLQWVCEMLEENCSRVPDAEGDAFEWWSLPTIKSALAGTPVTPSSEKWCYLPNANFQGRVLGEFPTQIDEQVIPRGWFANLPEIEPVGLPEIGCDVARFGSDRTAVAVRQGDCLMSLSQTRHMDNEAVATLLIRAAEEAARLVEKDLEKVEETAKLIPIRIDVTGGLGTGPYDRLRKLGYKVRGVNVSCEATRKTAYNNSRSELWFSCQDRVRRKCFDLSRLPPTIRQSLIREMSIPKYTNDHSGRKVVEPKVQIKKRLGYSPDLAEAVNLAFYSQQSWCRDPAAREQVREILQPGSTRREKELAPLVTS